MSTERQDGEHTATGFDLSVPCSGAWQWAGGRKGGRCVGGDKKPVVAAVLAVVDAVVLAVVLAVVVAGGRPRASDCNAVTGRCQRPIRAAGGGDG